MTDHDSDTLAEENANLACLVDVLRSSCKERKCIAEQALAMGELLKAENARLQETVACAKSTMDGLADEAVRVLALVNATRRLVAALPTCSECCSPGIIEHWAPKGETVYSCEEHGAASCDGYGEWGEPLRDTIAALAALDKETS